MDRLVELFHKTTGPCDCKDCKIKQLEAESQKWFEEYKHATNWLVVILRSTQLKYKITSELFAELLSGGWSLNMYDSNIDNTKVISLED